MGMYTIKDIAEIVGKDKSNVYRYIKKNAIAHTATRGQTLVYSDAQKNAIVAGLKDISNATNAQQPQRLKNSEVIDSEMTKVLEERISDLKEQNQHLIDQLNEKDQEIHAKNEQINEAHKLIDQQQQLNLSTQKLLIPSNNSEDSTQKDDFKENKDSVKQDTDVANAEVFKKSFWKKLFG
ncbi:helix-turn-helix domain-containing protein [Weissella paramesenteroides]|uniref:helix-turn-helix domain-containing protein n=1 Tax=Weissella paramesenteroides TaxID=1249 RepID=UPI002402C3DF|nr:helix-turn-helix domain-containing protein [Weissella paramesenteroides]MDF8367977.1 helix-turn-helix domain-containing protein [Weissella paramesenteroides]